MSRDYLRYTDSALTVVIIAILVGLAVAALTISGHAEAQTCYEYFVRAQAAIEEADSEAITVERRVRHHQEAIQQLLMHIECEGG